MSANAPQLLPPPVDDASQVIDALLARLERADRVFDELCAQLLAPPP